MRVEVRSVNHRHLQVKLRLPAEVSHLEPPIEALVRGKLGRGAVNLVVHLDREGSMTAARIDEDVAVAYAERLSALASRLGIEDEVELEDLLALPGVVAGREDRTVDGKVEKLLTKTVKIALAELVEMREREGVAMGLDLQKHASAIHKLLARIAKRMPTVVKGHQTSLGRRVEELLADGSRVAPSDLAREVALIADRLDVSEELSRLDAHLGQLASLLSKGGTIGRKLDFLAQEFFREANTIGSKCSDAKVAHAVVDLKTSIERLREQVQNVE